MRVSPLPSSLRRQTDKCLPVCSYVSKAFLNTNLNFSFGAPKSYTCIREGNDTTNRKTTNIRWVSPRISPPHSPPSPSFLILLEVSASPSLSWSPSLAQILVIYYYNTADLMDITLQWSLNYVITTCLTWGQGLCLFYFNWIPACSTVPAPVLNEYCKLRHLPQVALPCVPLARLLVLATGGHGSNSPRTLSPVILDIDGLWDHLERQRQA